MRLAERHAGLAHQPVGEVGGGGVAGGGGGAHPLRRRTSRSRPSRPSPRATGRAGRAPRTPAACRPACPSHKRAAGPSAVTSSATSAPTIRAEWPRTSSAASGLRFCGMIDEPVDKASGRRDEAERLARPEDELLGQPRQMEREQSAAASDNRATKSRSRDRVERVGGRPVEAERQRGRLAVDRKAGAGQRRRAQRAFVHPRAGVGEARCGRGAASRNRPSDGGRASPAGADWRWVKPGMTVAGMLLGAGHQRALQRVDAARRPRRSRRAPRA